MNARNQGDSSAPEVQYRWWQQLRLSGVATLTLMIGLSLSLVGWYLTRADERAIEHAQLQSSTERIAAALTRRLDNHYQILLSAAAHADTHHALTESDWQRFTAGLRLHQRHPEVVALGYTRFDTSTLAENDPRQQAWRKARDSGAMAMSAPLPAQAYADAGKAPLVALYLPVYRDGARYVTVAERRAAWLGDVYLVLRTDIVINKMLSRGYPAVSAQVYAGPFAEPQHLIYGSRREPAVGAYAMRRPMLFGGAEWTIVCHLRAAGTENGRSSQLLITGLVVTLLLSLVLNNLAATRNRAFGMASLMNRRLLRSQSELRAVLDSAADGILSVDREGVVQSANQAAEHIFGIAAGKLLGVRLESKLVGFDAARLTSMLGEYAGSTHSVARCEAEGLRASGECFPLALSLSQFELDGEMHFSLMVRDISDEKMAEAILQLRLQAIEAANDGIVIADMTLPGHPITYANPAFARITGYDADDIVGRSLRVLHQNDLDQPGLAQLKAAIAEGRPFETLLRNYRKDGTLFWNSLSVSPVRDAQGKVTHYVGSQCDVTAQVQVEEKLAERSARLDAVFRLSPDGLVTFDAHGRISHVNPAFMWMSGCEEGQLLGLDAAGFDQLLASRCDAERPYMPLPAAGSSDVIQGSCLVYLARPTHCILARSVRAVSSRSEERVVYFRDVTHETEVDRIKSEFLSTAAHELRTPMASIFGYSELLLHRKFNDETQRELYGTIHRQAQLLINLINELLDLARIEARAGQDFLFRRQSLADVVQKTVASLWVNDDPRKVQVQVPDDLMPVLMDEEKVTQALTNVLVNAYKYSPQGGAIELEVLSRAGFVGMQVRDHGLGLSPEHRSRLFERFFRADPSGNIPGTGLGMCIVKEIMELHGGTVEVDSTLGQGTSVTLWLPASEMSEELSVAA
ncbi:PAS domain S-box protein [Duganella fentianensis]|uniref:PAS domain S-box protein n=1 Tax=Duganella fentianensis TaxID=2692177 RepID=UPI0032B0FD59